MSYEALLFCPDEKTARVVKQVLNDVDFHVEPCNEPFAAVKRLMAQRFDAIVVDCENEQNANLLFKSAHNSAANQGALSVAVVEGQAGVAKAFRLGANLVLTKPINVEQSKGTLRVARGLLRKGEAAKPGGTLSAERTPVPTSTISDPVRPVSAASAPAKPTFAPIAPPKPAPAPRPAASASTFEVDEEPAPKPEPAEAALLESMPEPPMPRSQPTPAAGSPPLKEYPWQPVSRQSGAMASALRRAAEAAGKSVEPESAVDDSEDILGIAPKESHPLAGAIPSSSGSAAAAAPAKEASPWGPKPLELKPPASAMVPPADTQEMSPVGTEVLPAPVNAPIEPPSFGASAEAFEEEGSNKKLFIIAAAVVLVAVVGYFGWSKQRGTGSQSAPTPPAAAQSASTSASGPAASQPSSQNTEPQFSAEVKASPLKESKPAPTIAKSAPSNKAENIDVAPDTTKKVTEDSEAEEPLVVKSGSAPAKPKPVAEEESQIAAPPVIGVAANSDNKAIAGIVSTPSVALPKAAPQSLRVSQGIAQGLLIKRVPPAYPPQAQQMRIQGAVDLAATISKDGNITNIKVLRGDPVLANAAVQAVRQWKYKPYYLDGEPVEIQTQITINFKLP